MMMMMMMISAIALKRHQPYDQRTIADILLISPQAFEQSVIHFPPSPKKKVRLNLFCLKINKSIIAIVVYLFSIRHIQV